MITSSEEDWSDHSQHECGYQRGRQNRQRLGMYPEEQNRSRDEGHEHISRPSLKSTSASIVIGIGNGAIRATQRPTDPPNATGCLRLCWHNIIAVHMILPYSSFLTSPDKSLSPRNRPARHICAFPCRPHPLVARLLSCPSFPQTS